MNKSTDYDEEDDEDVEIRQYKVVLLGDGAVGKTSIANRFAENKFAQVYKQTVGVDFFIKRLKITPKLQVALQLWDIGGQSIGSKMISSYISGAHALLFCYDITNLDSFQNLDDWYRIAYKTFDEFNMPYTALIGNKADLKHMAVVRSEVHGRFALENEMASFLMSAKNGDHVQMAFWKVATTLAGVSSSRTDIEGQVAVVPAQIIDHKRHDDDVNNGTVPNYTKQNSDPFLF